MRQVLAVMLLGARSLPQRLRSALLIIVALVCVTVPPLAIIAMGLSLKASYLKTAAPDRVLILSEGAGRQSRSHVWPSWRAEISAAPGIRQWQGQPLLDFELATGFHPPKRTRPEKGNAMLRGFGPPGFVLRPELKPVAGRLPRPNSQEVAVGLQAARKFAGLEIGRRITIADTAWRVVGIFHTGGNLDGDLIGDAGSIKAALHRGSYDVAVLSLASPDGLARLRAGLRGLPVTAVPEPDYYAGLWQQVPKLAFYTAVVLLLIIGGGALASTTHCVYAAIASRGREIVILRAIGFDSVAISASLLLETVLVAGLGACVGTGIVWLWVEGYPYNGGIEGGIFRITMTWTSLLIALSWAAVVALAGGVMPCLKAGRSTVAEAMREL